MNDSHPRVSGTGTKSAMSALTCGTGLAPGPSTIMPELNLWFLSMG